MTDEIKRAMWEGDEKLHDTVLTVNTGGKEQ